MIVHEATGGIEWITGTGAASSTAVADDGICGDRALMIAARFNGFDCSVGKGDGVDVFDRVVVGVSVLVDDEEGDGFIWPETDPTDAACGVGAEAFGVSRVRNPSDDDTGNDVTPPVGTLE